MQSNPRDSIYQEASSSKFSSETSSPLNIDNRIDFHVEHRIESYVLLRFRFESFPFFSCLCLRSVANDSPNNDDRQHIEESICCQARVVYHCATESKIKRKIMTFCFVSFCYFCSSSCCFGYTDVERRFGSVHT